MSHQGYEGWFPECALCRRGNVGAIVCLDPTCHEQWGLRPVVPPMITTREGHRIEDEKLVHEDSHWWKCCQLCDGRVHADPGAWGSTAICVACFNKSVATSKWPGAPA
jgi:hypothetical protein